MTKAMYTMETANTLLVLQDKRIAEREGKRDADIAAAVAQERERCARICDEVTEECKASNQPFIATLVMKIAAAIRSAKS